MEFEHRYSILDKLLHQLAFSTAQTQLELDDLEEKFYGGVIAHQDADRPVFITALPRAGTTLLLELCDNLEEFATHTYRDMPFVLLPLMWNRFSKRFRQNDAPRERAHGDGMLINYDSPEAFEEMIWMAKWRDQYLPDRIEPWRTQENSEFRSYFNRHINKITSLRQENKGDVPRYISKNNLNIARIEWILNAFPDARFIISVRDPLQHAASLLRQHHNFLKIHAHEPFSRKYMAGIGHFDFGANHRPINFNGWLDTTKSKDATELSYWIEYWVEAYSYLRKHQGEQVRLLFYEAFCEKPKQVMESLAGFLEIEGKDNFIEQSSRISWAQPHSVDTSGIDAELLNKACGLYEEMQATLSEIV